MYGLYEVFGSGEPMYPTAPSATAAGDSQSGIVGPSDATPATNRDLQQEPGALTRRPGRGGR
jgi:hypothetical protein